MVDSNQFFVMVKRYFNFLIREYNFFLLEEKTTGNFYYEVQFKKKGTIISISYENNEDYLSIIIFRLQNGKIPCFTDSKNIIELKSLALKVFSELDQREINKNNKFFSEFKINSLIEKKILNSARKLRFCFPYYEKEMNKSEFKKYSN